MGDRSFRETDFTGESLLPVVVRQLLDAKQEHTGARFDIGGRQVWSVKLVAAVVSLDGDNPMKLILEDGSRGRITATQWDVNSRIKEHMYVCVIGTLDRFRGCNSLKVKSSRPVEDCHEIYYHLLDAMASALISERGPPPLIGGKSISEVVHGPDELSGKFHESEDISLEISEDFSDSMRAAETSPISANTTLPLPQSSSPRLLCAAGSHLDSKSHDSRVSGFNKGKGKPRDYEDLHDPGTTSPGTDCSGALSTPYFSPAASFEELPTSDYQPVLVGGTRSPLSTHTSLPLADSSSNSGVTSGDYRRTPSKRNLDPFSNLTPLQRKVYLCISEADRPTSLYPSLRGNVRDDYEGVNVKSMSNSIFLDMPSVEPDEIEQAIGFLLENEYIRAPVNEHHLRVTR